MNGVRQQDRDSGAFAGFYFRSGSKSWFWGWGAPHTRAGEISWSPVAEWLRRMRSRAATIEGAKLSFESEARQPARDSASDTSHAAHPSRVKRKFRFVCDRHVIGLVFGPDPDRNTRL